MTESRVHLCADGHLHVYPGYDVPVLLGHLSARLDAIAGMPREPAAVPLRMGLLAESRSCHFYRTARAGSSPLLRPGPEEGCLTVEHAGRPLLLLVAGRQIVTAERIEILALTADLEISDGLPAGETLAAIRAGGGIPALAWAPGKWWFGRGRLVRGLLEQAAPGDLLLMDSLLRPAPWPEPVLVRLGREKGLACLAGSDPLPLEGEERLAGGYGFTWEGSFDPDRPVSELRRVLRAHGAEIVLAGQRGSPWSSWRRWSALAAAQRRSGVPSGKSPAS